MNLAKMGWIVAATIALSTWAAAEQVNAVVEQVKVDVFNWYIATPKQSEAMRALFKKNPELFYYKGQVVKHTGNMFEWKTSNVDLNGDWEIDIATIDWVKYEDKYEDSSCGTGECTAATPFAKD